MENGRNSAQIIQEEKLLENGRNFGRFQTTTVVCWKTTETTPKSVEWKHCWKTAETTLCQLRTNHTIVSIVSQPNLT